MLSLKGSRNKLQHHLDRHCNSVEAPSRYSPLDTVYSTSFVCAGATNVMSKKVTAGKLASFEEDFDELKLKRKMPLFSYVYTRRPKKLRGDTFNAKPSFFNVLLDRVEPKLKSSASFCSIGKLKETTKRLKLNRDSEFVNLRIDASPIEKLARNINRRNFFANKDDSVKGPNLYSNVKKRVKDPKRWVRLIINDVDPHLFSGLPCKVYWPSDADWYSGRIVRFNSDTDKHQIEYDDGDLEDLVLANEKVKFFISPKHMEKLNLSPHVKDFHGEDYDYDEMVVLAASLNDSQDFEPGDIVWAKLTGHAMWPAVVVDESLLQVSKGLKNRSSSGSVLVQFFGTHDFARVKPKQMISFLKGLLSSFHLKCKKSQFTRSLEEAKLYLSKQKLPRKMVRSHDDLKHDSCESLSRESEGHTESDEDFLEVRRIRRVLDGLTTSPYIIGDLQISNLGKIVKDSEYFKDDQFIWPEGYTALRKINSASDPSVSTIYKMEVLRDHATKIRPLFRVTLNNEEKIEGPSPSACWKKMYKSIRMSLVNDETQTSSDREPLFRSGADLFGFSNPEVIKLIKGMSQLKVFSNLPCKVASHHFQNLPIGYRPVRVKWKDLDKCNVCHMAEEYENNLLLQCDRCRMMVHAKCYGELEPINGILWFCNLCRPNAPDPTPPCCLCPVVGGAMKPTTDGRWAHLSCAIWIPETCLSDVKKMEPIDGIKRISRDRWKLLCTICGVAYGACIQCSSNGCRTAFHPLCARAAGLCLEFENDEKIHLSVDDYDSRSIRFLSFCKRHRRRSQNRLFIDSRMSRMAPSCSDYIPPVNPSGCARTEPYDYFGRRGLKEPAALAAPPSKHLYVENQPYLVCGFGQHKLFGPALSISGNLQKLKGYQLDAPNNILSMAEKYSFMCHTIRKRLAFGKSSIHGFGIFAKHPHRAGDMVIEYVGELVRPPIADRRERLIYNSLVGAGTYMFRIDDERVIDATRAGSIAHLINHSCEPNCYSRVISVNGDDHIIIYAKRDLKRWEELTYDYRFSSIDEQLPCYCGAPRCRGIVNDVEAGDRLPKLCAPRNELISR